MLEGDVEERLDFWTEDEKKRKVLYCLLNGKEFNVDNRTFLMADDDSMCVRAEIWKGNEFQGYKYLGVEMDLGYFLKIFCLEVSNYELFIALSELGLRDAIEDKNTGYGA